MKCSFIVVSLVVILEVELLESPWFFLL